MSAVALWNREAFSKKTIDVTEKPIRPVKTAMGQGKRRARITDSRVSTGGRSEDNGTAIWQEQRANRPVYGATAWS